MKLGFESVKALAAGEHPDVSWVGIGLAIGSAILMPVLGIAKQRLADQLGSAATAGEGRQNMLCAYLAAALLVGLLGNALAGAWWLDPAVGLLIVAVAGAPCGDRRGTLQRARCPAAEHDRDGTYPFEAIRRAQVVRHGRVVRWMRPFRVSCVYRGSHVGVGRGGG